MKKHPILFALLVSIIASCNRSGNKIVKSKNSDEMKSGYASVGELNMYYEIHGDGGTPLVLIHGGGSTIQSTFGKILPLLSANRQVVAVELQAHGHTADIDRPLSFRQDADDVASLLQRLFIRKADFFGFSNGGQTTMQIAMTYPDIVNKLIIASAFYSRDGTVPGFFDGLEQATIDNMPAPLKTAFLDVDPNKDHLQKMFDRDRNRMLEFKDWSDDDVRSIKAPTLILLGDHDILRPEHAIKMSHLISNSRLMILPGDHGSYIGEICTLVRNSKVPELTEGFIEEFLNK
jgi:pimeloyl-ACP methyl ester carboxylesterase